MKSSSSSNKLSFQNHSQYEMIPSTVLLVRGHSQYTIPSINPFPVQSSQYEVIPSTIPLVQNRSQYTIPIFCGSLHLVQNWARSQKWSLERPLRLSIKISLQWAIFGLFQQLLGPSAKAIYSLSCD